MQRSPILSRLADVASRLGVARRTTRTRTWDDRENLEVDPARFELALVVRLSGAVCSSWHRRGAELGDEFWSLVLNLDGSLALKLCVRAT